MPQHVQPSESVSADRNPLTAGVYATLRSAISSGELQPDERLDETVLARRFKMSRTPVREALQRLVIEGLVEGGADGVYVATLSVQDVRSLEQANRALQSLAAQLAAAAGSEDDLERLEGFVARMEACAVSVDLDGWIAADQEMHRQIFRMCGNRCSFRANAMGTFHVLEAAKLFDVSQMLFSSTIATYGLDVRESFVDDYTLQRPSSSTGAPRSSLRCWDSSTSKVRPGLPWNPLPFHCRTRGQNARHRPVQRLGGRGMRQGKPLHHVRET